jgi:hypothetical protein
MDVQEINDRRYFQNGPCCAGCDHWETIGGQNGQCKKAAPVSGYEVMKSLGMYGFSYVPGPDHPYTLWNHHCGDFKDSFDWSSLPLLYRKRVGCPC